MILKFQFRSDPIDSADLSHQILARTAQLFSCLSLHDLNLGTDPEGARRIWIRIEFDAAEMKHSPADFDSNDASVAERVSILKAAGLARQVAQEFAQKFAGGANWSWAVGHEMESHLGTISADSVDPELNRRLLETLHIAWSLAQINQDDSSGESVADPSGIVVDHSVSRDVDGESEGQAFYLPECFTRFPELD